MTGETTSIPRFIDIERPAAEVEVEVDGSLSEDAPITPGERFSPRVSPAVT